MEGLLQEFLSILGENLESTPEEISERSLARISEKKLLKKLLEELRKEVPAGIPAKTH